MKSQQQINQKAMTCKFFVWYISGCNTDIIEKELINLPNTNDICGDMYDIWLSKYFTPDTI